MSSLGVHILGSLRPLIDLIPDIKIPEKKIPIREKLLWTGMVLVFYLVCSQLPLYGIGKSPDSDAFFWSRAILASSRGSLMELGISPIVSAGLFMQLLVGLKLLSINQSSEDEKELFAGAQKLFGLFITLGQSMIYVSSGMYGEWEYLGAINALLLVLQLFIAGVLMIVWDEFLQKGWGMGSGISLFIATNVCETVVWRALSPTTHTTRYGVQFEGALVALVHLCWVRESWYVAIKEALFRPNLPNCSNLIGTIITFVVIVMVQGIKVDLPIKHKNQRGGNDGQSSYPIKLFYTSNIPIILQTTLLSQFYFLSQLLSRYHTGNMLVRFIGEWKENPTTGQFFPINGLAYYISPPLSLSLNTTNMTQMATYVITVLSLCAFFSKIWVEVGGSSPKDVARQMADYDMVMKGHRKSSLIRLLYRYIPIAAIVGGVCVGLLSIIADTMGAIGSGTGILLAISIITQYNDAMTKESFNFF
jgi:protein transport protein SEC61 subunit alpha